MYLINMHLKKEKDGTVKMKNFTKCKKMNQFYAWRNENGDLVVECTMLDNIQIKKEIEKWERNERRKQEIECLRAAIQFLKTTME